MLDHLTDRNRFIAHIFTELQHIERAVADDSPSRTNRYIDGGEWLIRPGFALDCLRTRLRRPSHQPILAGVSAKGLVRLCQSYLRGATFRLASPAAAVNVRQRADRNCVIRTFYPFTSEPTTVKASLSGHSLLEAEIENRRIAAEIGHLRAPEILAHDFSARCPFLIEQFVTGRIAFRRRDHTLLSQTLLPSLRRHYETYGVSYGPIKPFFGSDFYAKVEQAAGLLPWDQQWRDRQQFLSVVGRLAGGGKQVALSFCHGDLSVGHVAVSDDGRIFLLDWERGGVQPIAFDLAKIERTCRKNEIRLYDECERLMRELSPPVESRDLFSPAEQMFLASLRRIVAWQEKYQILYELQGRDPAAELRSAFGNANELLKHAE